MTFNDDDARGRRGLYFWPIGQAGNSHVRSKQPERFIARVHTEGPKLIIFSGTPSAREQHARQMRKSLETKPVLLLWIDSREAELRSDISEYLFRFIDCRNAAKQP